MDVHASFQLDCGLREGAIVEDEIFVGQRVAEEPVGRGAEAGVHFAIDLEEEDGVEGVGKGLLEEKTALVVGEEGPELMGSGDFVGSHIVYHFDINKLFMARTGLA